ncbi:hypothetical protein [Methylorubrum populi]|uniref:Uncharacterized protein n=1 Tax=Methylorubrum populi TaxID=223967 RepID=A0A833J0D8_9HYPH|nr:hypothetical protein [Methylorubrum populi]KAB7782168.1 hypothetical protein F8B43_4923 [Methylorubrum populi]
MFSLEIFSFVENTLSAVLGFFHSTIVSIYLLLRSPASAPRYLSRRLRDPNKRQVGPLTLIFLMILIASGVALVWTPLNVKALLEPLFKEEQRPTFVKVAGSCLFGTTVIDLFSRVCVGLGWPWSQKKRILRFEHAQSAFRRTVLNYELVIVALIGMVICFLSTYPAILIIRIWEIAFGDIDLYEMIGAIIITASLIWIAASTILVRTVFPNLVIGTQGGSVHSLDYWARSLQLGKEVLIPSLIAGTCISVLTAQRLIPKYNPMVSAAKTSMSEVYSRQHKCYRIKNDEYKIITTVINKFDDPYYLELSGKLVLTYYDSHGNDNDALSEKKLEYNHDPKKADRTNLAAMIGPKSYELIEIVVKILQEPAIRVRECNYTFNGISEINHSVDSDYVQDVE